ncbi:aggregation promoting factor surface protein [Lentilactobacillus sp. SPB1-3]|uniref:Aggregation promoting factor surface protein n=1 Tax=Lentilactobacillus terminaliae TaxID=3003483 RepID=A0ACD5DER4_9LACO|nr:aggregation promoting factor surface protein [Lentilactobacillus sp. SPB1-3]MCZ0977538.1 aggregation promoting factor surface protein [Lentilactobacillus sp. SPB1-3]
MNFKKLVVVLMSALTLFGTFESVVTPEVASAKTSKVYKSNLSKANKQAKEWIAYRESRGSYRARNGQYIGRYQLSSSYLHGDYSKANQEKTADRYVSNRYGSWVNAKRHWLSHGWY